MEWHIDTGAVGEVAAKDLRGVLEKSRDHFLKTQADHASAQIVDARDKAATADAVVAVAKRGDEAKAKHVEKQGELAKQIGLGIDQACAQADLFGGTVTASVRGHHNPRHASGAAQRLSVQVDQVAAG